MPSGRLPPRRLQSLFDPEVREDFASVVEAGVRILLEEKGGEREVPADLIPKYLGKQVTAKLTFQLAFDASEIVVRDFEKRLMDYLYSRGNFVSKLSTRRRR